MTRLLRTAATMAMVVTATSTLGAEAASDPKLTRPLPVGTRLPTFVVRDVHGAAVEFSPDRLTAPVVRIKSAELLAAAERAVGQIDGGGRE